MNEIYDGFWLLLPILLSGASGIGLLLKREAGKRLHLFVGVVLVLSVGLMFAAV